MKTLQDLLKEIAEPWTTINKTFTNRNYLRDLLKTEDMFIGYSDRKLDSTYIKASLSNSLDEMIATNPDTTNNNLGEVGYSDKVKHYYSDGVDLQDRKDKIGIYLHWNGGRDSINSFLAYCNIKGYRDPAEDNYGMARFIQVISNFFGGSNSIGVDTLNHLDCDNYNNGVYIIGPGWQIVDRVYFEGQEQTSDDPYRMIQAINAAQPEKERLSEEDLKQAYDKIKNKYKGM